MVAVTVSPRAGDSLGIQRRRQEKRDGGWCNRREAATGCEEFPPVLVRPAFIGFLGFLSVIEGTSKKRGVKQ
jgi:hypothetical protein